MGYSTFKSFCASNLYLKSEWVETGNWGLVPLAPTSSRNLFTGFWKAFLKSLPHRITLSGKETYLTSTTGALGIVILGQQLGYIPHSSPSLTALLSLPRNLCWMVPPLHPDCGRTTTYHSNSISCWIIFNSAFLQVDIVQCFLSYQRVSLSLGRESEAPLYLEMSNMNGREGSASLKARSSQWPMMSCCTNSDHPKQHRNSSCICNYFAGHSHAKLTFWAYIFHIHSPALVVVPPSWSRLRQDFTYHSNSLSHSLICNLTFPRSWQCVVGFSSYQRVPLSLGRRRESKNQQHYILECPIWMKGKGRRIQTLLKESPNGHVVEF